MMLNREKPVWRADEHAPGNATKLVQKEGLIFKAADMFNDSIRGSYVKGVVVKRQTDIGLNVDIADQRECLLELNAAP